MDIVRNKEILEIYPEINVSEKQVEFIDSEGVREVAELRDYQEAHFNYLLNLLSCEYYPESVALLRKLLANAGREFPVSIIRDHFYYRGLKLVYSYSHTGLIFEEKQKIKIPHKRLYQEIRACFFSKETLEDLNFLVDHVMPLLRDQPNSYINFKRLTSIRWSSQQGYKLYLSGDFLLLKHSIVPQSPQETSKTGTSSIFTPPELLIRKGIELDNYTVELPEGAEFNDSGVVITAKVAKQLETAFLEKTAKFGEFQTAVNMLAVENFQKQQEGLGLASCPLAHLSKEEAARYDELSQVYELPPAYMFFD